MTRPPAARLFAALDPPAWVCNELAGWGRSARRGNAQIRVLDVDLLHVTLCFLGWCPVTEIEAIGTSVTECAAPVEGLEVGAPLWLPPRRPRVLAVELRDGRGELTALQAEVSRALTEAVAWEPERRRYRPHLTVARMREGSAPRERQLPATPALTFTGEALTLYRSFLSPAGARYEPVASVRLGSNVASGP